MKKHLSKKATLLSMLLVSMMGGTAYNAFATSGTSGLGLLDTLPKELHGEIGKHIGLVNELGNNLKDQHINASQLHEGNIDAYKLLGDLILTLDRSDEKTLKLVGQLTNLKVIFLTTNQTFASEITDATLAHFKDLKNLEEIKMNYTSITDAGLAHLKDLKNLQKIFMSHTKITDAGLVHLKDMKNLKVLYMDDTLVKDAGLVHLKDLDNLLGISLAHTEVTDAGLAHLKDLKNLQSINLGKTKITNAALIYLKGFKKLKYIMLVGTKITDAEAAELRKSFPNAEIYHSFLP